MVKKLLRFAMNRMSPLIRTRSMAYVPLPAPVPARQASEPSALMQDVREFLVGWLGGLVFFGTFLA